MCEPLCGRGRGSVRGGEVVALLEVIEQGAVVGCPAEQLLRVPAGRGCVGAEHQRHERVAEVLAGVLGGNRPDRHAELFGDLPGDWAFRRSTFTSPAACVGRGPVLRGGALSALWLTDRHGDRCWPDLP